MEERSLRIYNSEKTFFSKLTNTLTKIIVPTQIGINSVLISMKRNNVLKAYEGTLEDTENQEKKESAKKKFEDVYALYLEAVDKHIMDSIYKKVKNDTATDFEKNALSNCLKSIKGFGDIVGEELYKIAHNTYDNFLDIL